MSYCISHVEQEKVNSIVNVPEYRRTGYLSSEDSISLINEECSHDPFIVKEIVDNLKFKKICDDLESPYYEDFVDILNLIIKVSYNTINYVGEHYDPVSNDKFNIREFVLADFEKLSKMTLKFLKGTYFGDDVLAPFVEQAIANHPED